MEERLLIIRSLRAGLEDKEILKGIDLEIGKGETHVIMGPNGAGKSTLGNVIMGNPAYIITAGTAEYCGEDLFEMPVSERAKKGIFMSFQNPIEVPGISLENFLRSASEEVTGERVRIWPFHKEIEKNLGILDMDSAYADRDLNVGFSGGEKKKAEILQLMMLKPKLAILDETDSGLDVDAVKTVSEGIKEYQKDADASLLIITHNAAILESLRVDKVHVIVDGRIADTKGPELIDEIARNGFAKYEEQGE